MAYNQEKLKAYIFDLDGTLLDSMQVWNSVLLGCLDERKIFYPKTIMRDIAALGLYRTCEYLHERYLPDESADELFAHFTSSMKKQYDNVITLKPNAEKLLRHLKAQGVSLNVLTAGVHSLFDGCLKRLDVEKYFDNIWSTEDFCLKKTDKNIYTEVAKRLGVVPSECAMLDDNVYALKAAKAAGFCAIGVYDEVEKAAKTQMLSNTDLYIQDFAQLL